MIWNTLINFVLDIINLLLGFFPNVNSTFNSNLVNVISTLKSSLSVINFVFPIDVLFNVMSIIISLYVAKYVIKLIRIIINLIPGVSAN
jgi:hypothetical protein